MRIRVSLGPDGKCILQFSCLSMPEAFDVVKVMMIQGGVIIISTTINPFGFSLEIAFEEKMGTNI